MRRYYIDTCIWIDLYEGREGYSGKNLSKYAFELFVDIMVRKDKIIITDLLANELGKRIPPSQLDSLFLPFKSLFEKIPLTDTERKEAEMLGVERSVPSGDALHAIAARDNFLILVTRDRHFQKLRDISEPYLPEDLV